MSRPAHRLYNVSIATSLGPRRRETGLTDSTYRVPGSALPCSRHPLTTITGARFTGSLAPTNIDLRADRTTS